MEFTEIAKSIGMRVERVKRLKVQVYTLFCLKDNKYILLYLGLIKHYHIFLLLHLFPNSRLGFDSVDFFLTSYINDNLEKYKGTKYQSSTFALLTYILIHPSKSFVSCYNACHPVTKI